MKEYAHAEFEILTEGYFGYSTTYTGWLWEKGKEPVSAILYIWNSRDMFIELIAKLEFEGVKYGFK